MIPDPRSSNRVIRKRTTTGQQPWAWRLERLRARVYLVDILGKMASVPPKNKEYGSWNMIQLREELVKRKAKKGGRKRELVQR